MERPSGLVGGLPLGLGQPLIREGDGEVARGDFARLRSRVLGLRIVYSLSSV